MVSYVRGRKSRSLSDAEIVTAYLGGEATASVAERAGCNPDTVLYLVRRAGHPTRPRTATRPHRPLPLSDDAICQLYRDGLSGPALADRCGASTATIYTILERRQVARRPSVETAQAAAAARRALHRKKPS